MNRAAYKHFIHSTNRSGSNKATSYVRALDLLGELITREPGTFSDCADVWAVDSISRLQELYEFVNEEKKKGDASIWHMDGIAPSYLQGGYYSAAMKSLQCFLAEHQHENALLKIFDAHQGEEAALPPLLDQNLVFPSELVEELEAQEGKEAVRKVRTRVNQRVFRRLVSTVYRGRCCITGLDIPQVNRASHIIPWSQKKATRMDPRNGLYLSATYDAAFDRNLITLDEDFRIILSKDIKDHYSSQSVQAYFRDREGDVIALPNSYRPKQEYLETHRMAGNF